MIRPELLVVGASWGGIDALRLILGALPVDLPLAVVLCQHRGRDDSDGLLEVLQRSSRLPLVEPADKDPIHPGRVYLAPADYHLLIDRRSFALTVDAPVNWARPSIDVLFESAAEAYRERLAALVLSGAGTDGARGLMRVKALGGSAAVQDPGTAQIAAMPAAALARVAGADVVPLDGIATYILECCTGSFRHAARAR